jgi:hypothetical protein
VLSSEGAKCADTEKNVEKVANGYDLADVLERPVFQADVTPNKRNIVSGRHVYADDANPTPISAHWFWRLRIPNSS